MATPDYRKAIFEFLLEVETPGQYSGGEWNSVKKFNKQNLATIALAFPDTYSVGMSHHGYRILYEIINNLEFAAAERVFTPLPDMERQLSKRNIPLCTLETFTPLSAFDAVGFSLQYELCATNILTMLSLSEIPILTRDRDENTPFIIAGGAGAFNPEPFADFIDLFLIGEGEEAIVEFMQKMFSLKNENLSREEKLLEIVSSCEGWYAPSLYKNEKSSLIPKHNNVPEVVSRRIVENFSDAPASLRPVVPVVQTTHERVTLEIMRGCPNGCRFCHAGMTTRPLRYRPVEKLLEQAKEIYKNTGFDEIGLLSLSTSDYPFFSELVKALDAEFKAKNVNISLPSLRVDSFLEKIPAQVKSVRKGGFTIAPEAATERLRRAINKDVTHENLMNGVENIFRAGWRSVKLYFMQGLPSETLQDVEAIAEIANEAATLKNKKRGGNAITLSVSNFVPKAHTPYQWHGMNSEKELLEKQNVIASKVNRKKVSYKSHDIKTSLLEGVISRGGRDVGKIIFDAWQKGARLCGWSEHFNHKAWDSAFTKNNTSPENYACREISMDAPLPWQHISSGISPDFLKREWQKTLKEVITVRCAKGCADCGVAACKLKP